MTKRNTEILWRKTKETKNPTQLKKVVLKFSKAQQEVAKLCPDSRTNTLFNTHLKLYLQRWQEVCCDKLPSYFPGDCAIQSHGSHPQEYSHL